MTTALRCIERCNPSDPWPKEVSRAKVAAGDGLFQLALAERRVMLAFLARVEVLQQGQRASIPKPAQRPHRVVTLGQRMLIRAQKLDECQAIVIGVWMQRLRL